MIKDGLKFGIGLGFALDVGLIGLGIAKGVKKVAVNKLRDKLKKTEEAANEKRKCEFYETQINNAVEDLDEIANTMIDRNSSLTDKEILDFGTEIKRIVYDYRRSHMILCFKSYSH